MRNLFFARQPHLRLGAAWPFIALMVMIALAGGSSRVSSLGQALVSGSSALAIAGWLALGRRRSDDRLRAAVIFMGLCALLVCVQLAPLPPGLWGQLPGHDIYANVARIAGTADAWRPLTIAPDLTWATLFGLLVPAAAILGLSRLTSRERAGLMKPIIVLILVSAVLGLAQVSGGPSSLLRWYGGNPDPSAIGFFANRNHQALLLACALPILAAFASYTPERAGLQEERDRGGGRWVPLATAAFLILMLPSTGSRAGLVLGAISVALAAMIAAPEVLRRLASRRRRQRRRMLVGATAAVLAFIAVFVAFGQNIAFSRAANLDPMADQRVQALPTVLQITRAFMPWGTGFGTFDVVFRRFEPFSLLKLTYFNEAHSDIVQVALEGGVPACALFVLFVVWWGYASVGAWRAERTPQALAARAGSSVILLCLLASIVDYPLRTPLMLFIFSVACVWLLTPRAARADRRLPPEPDPVPGLR